MALGQTITVVNRAGKVVSTRKHIANVFKEAQSAYRERKAELQASREADFVAKKNKSSNKSRPQLNDQASPASSRASSKSPPRRGSFQDRPPVERGYSDTFHDDLEMHRHQPRERSNLRFEQDLEWELQRGELTRRNTDGLVLSTRRPSIVRSASDSEAIDMDMAYGELPPPLPARRRDAEVELRGKMTKLQQLLQEANCIQHSATAVIENLQKNPDALAAVALTMGEISSLVKTMAPGALMTMKGAFPAAVALLLSPEFLIAAGVGLGITVIALGGYKIIKRIRKDKQEEKDADDNASEYDELQEIDADLSHVEVWRRGIAEAEASQTTSVDGEFLTPGAGRQLVANGVLKEEDLKTVKGSASRTGKAKSKDKKPTGRSKTGKDKKAEPSSLKAMFKNLRKPEAEPALV